MSKKKLTLEQELKRYQNIFSYGKLNEAENDFNTEDQTGDNAFGEENPATAEDQGVENPFGGDTTTETGDNAFGDQTAPETQPEGDTEVDVSDLVKGIEDANNSAANTKMQLDNASQKIEDMLGRIGGLENKLGVMDAILQKVDQLGISVEKMRPPTESERREALKQSSYPFNQSPEDFINKVGEQNASELEQRQTKLSFKDILRDFNAQDVQSSFNYKDPLNGEINKFMPPYRN